MPDISLSILTEETNIGLNVGEENSSNNLKMECQYNEFPVDDYYKKTEVDAKVLSLENRIPTKVSQLENDSLYVNTKMTNTEIEEMLK